MVVIALCFCSSLIAERPAVLKPTSWFGLQAFLGQKRAPVIMNHAAGEKTQMRSIRGELGIAKTQRSFGGPKGSTNQSETILS